MITFLFIALMIMVFAKLIWWAIKAAWGIMKILTYIVLFPVILIIMVFCGLIYAAIVILIIAGIIALIKSALV